MTELADKIEAADELAAAVAAFIKNHGEKAVSLRINNALKRYNYRRAHLQEQTP